MGNHISGMGAREQTMFVSRVTGPPSAAVDSAPVHESTPSTAIKSHPVLPSQRQGAPRKAASPDQLAQVLKELQEKAASYSPELKYSVDETTGESLVKLTDTSTNTLIWQFPSDEAIQIAKAIERYEKGLGFNFKA